MKILLTSTSFQDTPGDHHDLLNNTKWNIDYLRGPLSEDEIIKVVQEYDGLICGDDEITHKVILKGKEGRLKAISKYGIGLDKIDVKALKKYNIPLKNTPGVNHIAVAEHALALLFSFYKNIHLEYNVTKKGEWTRLIGNELYSKSIGIFGLGRIGKEIAIRSKALGLNVLATDVYHDEEFIQKNNIIWKDNLKSLIPLCDILSLNTPLTNLTKFCINKNILQYAKKTLLIINTSRGDIVDINDIILALNQKKIGGYLTDVLDQEPIDPENPLLKFENVLITPHIASRTYESVERQGSMAVKNLMELFNELDKR